MAKPLWVHTPTIYSQCLSELLDCDVYLKLENLQPSQSFKFRGMSYVAQLAKESTPNAHLIIASGGNAGLAAACAANAIDVQCTVYLPAGLDPHFLDSLKRERAHLVTGGKNYSEALAKAKEAVANNKNCLELSAYDDPNLWRGHASMIEEISTDLGVKPDAIFCSVGGAGLLAGVMVGCETVGWDDVPIVALETVGSDCFYHSIQANRRPKLSSDKAPPLAEGATTSYNEKHSVELVSLPAITSVASSLGASSPSAGAVKMALERKGGVICALVPDALSMQTALTFAADHKFLVELACSTTLVPAYQRPMFDDILPPRSDGKRRKVVFIVCGGGKISLEDMVKYRNIVGSETGRWKVWVEGKAIEFEK
ncbi:tryptophan synthase beta subunit-like PLP-dependent enzyme [Hysterangium stoloniferum]|nr:tryptophan synthase beta subunit-like PLP-dependent enzyme [Hysterangium stoloniferum]